MNVDRDDSATLFVTGMRCACDRWRDAESDLAEPADRPTPGAEKIVEATRDIVTRMREQSRADYDARKLADATRNLRKKA